jgi:hypothetical protein
MNTNNKIKVLVEKDGMKFTKLEKNKYNLTYSIENKNINLEPLVNFELIKLIYELNPDIYEKVVLNKISEEEGQIILLMKHFFNDLGFPQKYSYMGLKKSVSPNCINFVGASIFNEKPSDIPNEVELLPIEKLNIECIMVTPNKVNLNCVIVFHSSLIIPSFIEKVIGIIINKIFNRVKKFIENIKV